MKKTSKTSVPAWTVEYTVDRPEQQAVVIVVVASDWWEARRLAVHRLALASETVFSPALLVSRKP